MHARAFRTGQFSNKKEKRKTIQQELIYDAVEKLNIHATSEQVVAYLAEKHPTIGRATIYRNLGYMAETGDLLKICSFYGTTHYDHNCHEHYHFVCNNCKKVFDVEGNLSDVLERICDTKGFDIHECNISFSGLCWDCK